MEFGRWHIPVLLAPNEGPPGFIIFVKFLELLDIEGQEGWELGALLRDDQGFLGVFKGAIDRMGH
jgi:hypothetical protein